MKNFLTAATASLGIFTYTQPTAAEPFQIDSISAVPMALANLCTSLGGIGKPPSIVIHHSKLGGVSITVRMYDDTSRGSHINHRSTVVVSNAAGDTAVHFAFLPPCNKTGVSTSNYSIAAQAGGSRKEIIFGRYDSAARSIIK